MMKTVIKNLVIILISTVNLVSCNEKQKEASPTERKPINNVSYWPNDAQLVISVSMQIETGGQPEGAESPFSGNPLPKGNTDMPAQSRIR